MIKNKKIIVLLSFFVFFVALGILGYFKYYLFVYSVDTNQFGIERLFGKYFRTTSPGLHFTLPYPIIKIDRINATNVKQVEIGYNSLSNKKTDDMLNESQMLTGDENVVNLQLAVQYIISSPKDYLFSTAEPNEIILNSCKTATRNIIGKHTIDEVFTTGKSQIEGEIAEEIRAIWSKYNLGLTLLSVLLQKVNPPTEVSAAFKDVVNAKEDKSTFVYQADGYKEKTIREAKATAQKMVQEAKAYKITKIKNAQAEVDRFDALLKKYNINKDIIKKQLYYETMSDILPGIKVFVTSNGKEPLKLLNLK